MKIGLIHGSGKDNANWKGGRGKMYARVVAKELLEWKCSICDSREKLHVHHKDRNQDNNTLENLQVVCPKCHITLHKKERLMGSEKRRTGKILPCDYCGKLIYRPLWQLKLSSKSFCSKACSAKGTIQDRWRERKRG